MSYPDKCFFYFPLRPGILVGACTKLIFDIIIVFVLLLSLFFYSIPSDDYSFYVVCLYLFTTIVLIYDIKNTIMLIKGLRNPEDTISVRLYYLYGSLYNIVMVFYFLLNVSFYFINYNDANLKPYEHIIISSAVITICVIVFHYYFMSLVEKEDININGEFDQNYNEKDDYEEDFTLSWKSYWNA